ncbi:stage II sporulation protein M [Gracilibacillus ureilyticus]|uniref:Stage II sporulation protein M n=1 Tax=Gracilibacillus ureilyticus TaxID=531814 RepID=A0A1H9LUJ7_9BACI|nr:stage II sporulation protein M [Gracilibacillus ureilyticus]SER15018.1 stage II sporulation protein M [Gracilibacillus ureilyticus]
MTKKGNVIVNHLNQYYTIYIFTVILFLTGIIFGAIIVNSMSFIQKQDLYFYLENFFLNFLHDENIVQTDLFKNAMLYHIQFLALLFFLGLAVIGLPIIWILLFVKGVAVGFTVGYFVNQLGWKGLMLAFSSIASQNMVIIPIYIIASAFAMIFSFTLLQSILSKRYKLPVIQVFYRYIGVFFILTVGAAAAAGLESVISYKSMQMISDYFIK